MNASIGKTRPHTPLTNPEDFIPIHSMWQRSWLSKVPQWLGKEGEYACTSSDDEDVPVDGEKPEFESSDVRRVVPEPPRALTFQRVNSEKRERLEPHEPNSEERRAASSDRRRAQSVLRETGLYPIPTAPNAESTLSKTIFKGLDDHTTDYCSSDSGEQRYPFDDAYLHSGPSTTPASELEAESETDEEPYDARAEEMLQHELDTKWILNMSMHFRDKSDREKFFITYAETPNRWRRVTISCDYRNAAPDSWERTLQDLKYQRDKSARIYEWIRDSLWEIHFLNTVTNLKLETIDGRLHVNVAEDVNEIIPYPPMSSVYDLGCDVIPESQLEFVSHLSGFVYKVKRRGRFYIKKEIPGPDTVDEFLYEINALHDLSGSKHVIQFQGVIVDDRYKVVKGLLLSYADQGALVDLLYDHKGQLDWKRREKWAKQIVNGLAEIHEAGFVQGDFTLSNVVIDEHDNAKIIDINRRGCPVGWEPPEIGRKIQSGQRISMYIGVKSDLFQLGMTLWALGQEEDEPERQPRPLTLEEAGPEIPQYYRDAVDICLSDRPQDRKSAIQILAMFPAVEEKSSTTSSQARTRKKSLATAPQTKLLASTGTSKQNSLAMQSHPKSPQQSCCVDRTLTSHPSYPGLDLNNSTSSDRQHRGRLPPADMSESEFERVRPTSATGINESENQADDTKGPLNGQVWLPEWHEKPLNKGGSSMDRDPNNKNQSGLLPYESTASPETNPAHFEHESVPDFDNQNFPRGCSEEDGSPSRHLTGELVVKRKRTTDSSSDAPFTALPRIIGQMSPKAGQNISFSPLSSRSVPIMEPVQKHRRVLHSDSSSEHLREDYQGQISGGLRVFLATPENQASCRQAVSMQASSVKEWPRPCLLPEHVFGNVAEESVLSPSGSSFSKILQPGESVESGTQHAVKDRLSRRSVKGSLGKVPGYSSVHSSRSIVQVPSVSSASFREISHDLFSNVSRTPDRDSIKSYARSYTYEPYSMSKPANIARYEQPLEYFNAAMLPRFVSRATVKLDPGDSRLDLSSQYFNAAMLPKFVSVPQTLAHDPISIETMPTRNFKDVEAVPSFNGSVQLNPRTFEPGTRDEQTLTHKRHKDSGVSFVSSFTEETGIDCAEDDIDFGP